MPRSASIPDELKSYCERLRSFGLSDMEIARRLRSEHDIETSSSSVRRFLGPAHRVKSEPVSEDGRTNIRISRQDREAVQDIAAGLGLFARSGVEQSDGPVGSMTMLLRAIAAGDVVCVTKREQDSLYETIRELADPGSEIRKVADQAAGVR